jgi:hypothetical protein
MAPKDPFSKEQASWINATMPEFVKKLGQCKPCDPSQPEPKDDDDLKDWVAECKDKFLEKFKAELEASYTTIPDWVKVSIRWTISWEETYYYFQILEVQSEILQQKGANTRPCT